MEINTFDQASLASDQQTRRVLLVDAETLVRCAIAQVISSFGSYRIVGQADNMQDALQLVEKEMPQLLLTEIALPGPSGLELLLELRRRSLADLRPVVLSQVTSPDMVKQALLAGAQGYIFKSNSVEELRDALSQTLLNKRYVPPSLAHLANIPENAYELGKRPKINDPLEALSPREREIFHLLANGLQNTVIAQKLFISPRTVETHRARVVRKLGLNSNGELIRFAIKHGLTIV